MSDKGEKFAARVEIQGLVIQARGREGVNAALDALGSLLGAVLSPVTQVAEAPKPKRKRLKSGSGE